ncbi:hypothetical protein ACP3TJ_05275 [Desulforudis sp. 1088]|jgi:flagellar biosynthesis/type III secretory pathway protein FliH|uniref:hypothetical protein n=1 Tax=unclassified Candidatus Desulforudis TaxID=2635950 RepID=UPI0034802E95
MTKHERELGYNQGFAEGFEAGYEKGFSEGSTLGYNNGFAAGIAEVCPDDTLSEPSLLLKKFKKLVEAGLIKLVVSGPAEQEAKQLLEKMGLEAETLQFG